MVNTWVHIDQLSQLAKAVLTGAAEAEAGG
jgi:hypothetical protein